MKVKATEEICHKGVWYKPGEDLPSDYIEPKAEKNIKKSEVK